MKIVEIFPTLQQDASFIITRCMGKGTGPIEEQNRKVALAALRVIAAIGIAICAAVSVSILFSLPFEPIVSLIKLGITAFSFSICHDLFVISKNGTDQMNSIQKTAAQAQSVFKDVLDLLSGKKQAGATPRQPLTKGAIWENAWNEIFAKI